MAMGAEMMRSRAASSSTANSSKAPVVFVGFDSAWAGNPYAPGAICSAFYDGTAIGRLSVPELVGFDAALTYIQALHRPGVLTLVALDQPTIVPNETGMRPVEKLAATLISW